MDPAEIVNRLGLSPHPIEGGWFLETWRSAEVIPAQALERHPGPRSAGTAIYYLLTADTFSEMHRLPGDELFHFYLGDPVEMLQLYPDGTHVLTTLGTDLAAGMRPQLCVPRGVWQGSRVRAGGRWALLGATMAPGFDYADYQSGERELLIRRYPAAADAIRARTREPVAGS